MRIKTIQVSKLIEDKRNARVHDDRNIQAIRGSLRAFGQQKPIVVTTDGLVIAGNGTLAAARLEGWKTLKAVETSLSGADLRAYGVADNRTAELAEWDWSQVATILQESSEADVPLGDLGWDEGDLRRLAKAVAGGSGVAKVGGPEGSAEEVDVDGFSFGHKCPRCSFEFND